MRSMPTDTSATDRESPPGARQRAGRRFVVLAGAAILALIVYFLPVRAPQFAAVAVGGVDLALEVARTPEEYARGLSGRDELPGDGMLFLFDTPQPRVFWMRGMRFPIDIVWIRGETVVGIAADVHPSPDGTPDYALERFPSPGPVDRVIELAAGRASSLGVAPGQRISILLP